MITVIVFFCLFCKIGLYNSFIKISVLIKEFSKNKKRESLSKKSA